jgi:hypothetical protein
MCVDVPYPCNLGSSICKSALLPLVRATILGGFHIVNLRPTRGEEDVTLDDSAEETGNQYQ